MSELETHARVAIGDDDRAALMQEALQRKGAPPFVRWSVAFGTTALAIYGALALQAPLIAKIALCVGAYGPVLSLELWECRRRLEAALRLLAYSHGGL